MRQLISTKQIENGMVLATSIKNGFGQIILPEGTELEGSHIKMLKTWGISSIEILEDCDENNNFNFDPHIYEIAKEKLDKKLKWIPENEIEKGMYEMALIKLMENELST